MMDLLQTITELSHRFGSAEYVLAGGGNTSAKDESTLWVKPSGRILKDLTSKSFVVLDRKKLETLYNIRPPAESSARESLISELLCQAVVSAGRARASVETPLHDSLSATFVVHTHPALINGMTCAKDGEKVCRELFSDALWVEYIDPGYTLCMEVRKRIADFTSRTGGEPSIIFLKNHGVIAAADTAEQICACYERIFSVLRGWYASAGISTEIETGSPPAQELVETLKKKIRGFFGEEVMIAAGGGFEFATGPISPDHIVYSGSFPFTEEPTEQSLKRYRRLYACEPKVLFFDGCAFGTGPSEKKAAVALAVAEDGALVKKLADAFGGICYLDERARLFIENWDVESYRSKQI